MRSGFRSRQVKLFVSRSEVEECLAVAPDDRRMGTVSEGHLPSIVFSKTFARLARSPLQFGALRCVVKADALRNEATDELHAFIGVAASLKKLRRRNAANVLGDVLKRWFGPDAGRPGTSHSVRFELRPDGYCMIPENQRVEKTSPQLWRTYSRAEIPPLFGLTFSIAIWNAGFVSIGQQVFLLVTLEKGDLLEGHQYIDKFLSPDRFQWQSQNRTTQWSKHGQILQQHRTRGIQVHLFVRRTKKTNAKPTPFHYCGAVTFESWHGDQPITIDWRLSTPLPDRFKGLFLIPGNAAAAGSLPERTT